MANKSFSVKVGADTKSFMDEMKKADKQIKTTQNSAQALQKALELEYDQGKAELAQKQFRSALDLTEQKAEELRKQLKLLEDSGRVDTKDYQVLQTELVKTETKALNLNQTLEKINTIKFDNLKKELEKGITDAKRELSALEKAYSLNPDTKGFEKVQNAYGIAIDKTKDKTEALSKELDKLYADPTADPEKIKALKIEIIETQNETGELEKKLNDFETAAITKAKEETEKLKKELETAKNIKIEELSKKFEDVGNKIEGAGKKLAPFSAAAGGILAGMVKLSKDAVATGDDIATLADKYDMSTTAIQQWQYVAMQSDISSDVLYNAAQKVQSAVGNQMTGATNAATQALEKLGLSYKDFDSNEQAFEAVIKSLSQIENQSEQVAIATGIFGDQMATNLIPLFKQGDDAIAEYIKEFKQVGYLSEDTVKQLAELDNSVNNVMAQWDLAKTQLGVAMIPIYEQLIKILEEHVIPAVRKLAEWFDGLSPAGQNAVLGVLAVIAALAPMLILVGKVTTGVGELIKHLPNLGGALLKLTSPIGRVATGMATLAIMAKLVYDVVSAWGDMATWQKVVSVLGLVTVAALGAAIAFGAFHSAWSLGVAVAGIVAGIVAVTAAVNSAKKDIDGVDDFSAPNVTGGKGSNSMSAQDMADAAWTNTAKGNSNYNSNSYQSSEDNSTNNYYINIEANEYASAEEVADIVSKKIATLSQARGR